LRGVGLVAVQGKPINTFDQAAGNVASQRPKYNDTAPKGSKVYLRVSTGKAVLPDVTKMKVDAARAELNRKQFTSIGRDRGTTGPDKAKDGTVVAMDPTPGNAYAADVHITLTVYHYVAPAPTCDSNPVTPTPTPITSTSVGPTSTTTVTTTPTPTPTTSNGLPPC